MRDRLEVQAALIELISKIGKIFEQDVDEIKLLEKSGGVRITFFNTEAPKKLCAIRNAKLPGTNNRSGRPISDNIRIKWSWAKMTREAANKNSHEHVVYIWIDPKDFMSRSEDGSVIEDEEVIQKSLVEFLNVSIDSTAQLFKRPSCFYVFLPTKQEQTDLLKAGIVRTRPGLPARGVYKVHEKKGKEVDFTVPSWARPELSARSPHYRQRSDTSKVEPQKTSTPKPDSAIDTAMAVEAVEDISDDEADMTSTTPSTISNSFTFDSEDKLNQAVERVVEATLHKFVAGQLADQQARALAIAQNDRRMCLMEEMLIKLSDRIAPPSPQLTAPPPTYCAALTNGQGPDARSRDGSEKHTPPSLSPDTDGLKIREKDENVPKPASPKKYITAAVHSNPDTQSKKIGKQKITPIVTTSPKRKASESNVQLRSKHKASYNSTKVVPPTIESTSLPEKNPQTSNSGQ
jgi:hypothetical protein